MRRRAQERIDTTWNTSRILGKQLSILRVFTASINTLTTLCPDARTHFFALWDNASRCQNAFFDQKNARFHATRAKNASVVNMSNIINKDQKISSTLGYV